MTLALAPADRPPAATLRDRLRAETRVDHEAVEALLAPLSGAISLAAYRDILSRFLGFYEPWEARLAEALRDPSFYEPRRKLPLLRRDLRALGLSEADIHSLPRCPLVPPLATSSAALGSLYVGEGATLGGQLILRNVSARLGVDARSGAAFFASYGEAVGPMWRAMRTRLAGVPEGGRDAALAAARATFRAMRLWMAPESRENPLLMIP